MNVDIDYIKNNIDKFKNYKWLLVSSLQKSVRRGLEEEAVTLWNIAKEIDKFYVTYRLSIMAIEDIGLGNQDLVYDFLKTSLKKQNLIEKGGDTYLESVVRNLTLSVKDRTACDATWLSGKIEPPSLLKEDLINYFKDENLNIVERSLAAWLLTGTKKIKHPLITSLDENSNIEELIKLHEELNIDKKSIEVIQSSYPYQKEPHLFAYGLLSQIYEKEKDYKLGNYKTGDSFEKKIDTPIYDFNGIPILYSAVDGHTSEGKKVLDKIKGKKEIQSIISHLDEDKQSYLLKHALFKVEGQLVNKRLFYPTASQIYKNSQNFYNDGQTNLKELIKTVENMLPEINNIRESILNYTFKKNNSYKI